MRLLSRFLRLASPPASLASCEADLHEGWRLLGQQRPHEALALLERCVAQLGENLPSYAGLWEAYTATGQHQRALDLLEHAPGALPQHADLTPRRCRSLMALQHYDPLADTWQRWSLHASLPTEFYDFTADYLARLFYERAEQTALRKPLFAALLTQPDSTIAAHHVPALCRMLAHHHEYDAAMFERMRLELYHYTQRSGCDFTASKQQATLGLAFDLLTREEKRALMQRYLLQLSTYSHLAYVLWEQVWKKDVARKRENIELACEILPQLTPTTAAQYYQAHIIAHACASTVPTVAATAPDPAYDADIAAITAIAPAPSLVTRRSAPLSIALCISGQMRGFRRAYPSWAHLGLADHRVTTVLHTWSDTGFNFPEPPKDVRVFTGSFAKAYRDAWNLLGKSAMLQHYPHFFALFDETASHANATELADFYQTEHVFIDNESQPQFAGFSNSTKMHYKITACHQAARALPMDFDLVIRFRPDIELAPQSAPFDWEEAAFTSRQQRVLYSENSPYMFPHIGVCMGDQFAIAAPEVMDVYASTYDYTRQARQHGLQQFPDDFMPHRNLALRCLYGQVSVRDTPLLLMSKHCPAYRPSDEEMLRTLQRDSTGRMDAQDQSLLHALAQDMG